MDKVKKALYFDPTEWEKFSERAKRMGTTPSARIRELIFRDNFEDYVDKELNKKTKKEKYPKYTNEPESE